MKLRIKPKPKNQTVSTDNTFVKKQISEKDIPQPKFTYKKDNYTSKDSSDYKKGFRAALRDESSKKPNVINPDRTSGTLMVVGLNDRFNEGYSEGKDFVLKRNKNK